MPIKTSKYLAFKMYQKYGFMPEFDLERAYKMGDDETDLFKKLKNQYFKNLKGVYNANPDLFKSEKDKIDFVRDFNNMFFVALNEENIYNFETSKLSLGKDEDINIDASNNYDNRVYTEEKYTPQDIFKNIYEYVDDKNLKNIESKNIDKIREGSKALRASNKFSLDLNAICTAASELNKSIKEHEGKGFLHRLFNFRKLSKAREEYNNLINHLDRFHMDYRKLNDTKEKIERGEYSLNNGGGLTNEIDKFVKDENLSKTVVSCPHQDQFKLFVSKIGEISEKEVYDYYKKEIYNNLVSNEKFTNFNKIFSDRDAISSAKGYFDKQIRAEKEYEDAQYDKISSNEIKYDENGNVIEEEENYRRQVFYSDPTKEEQTQNIEIDEDNLETLNINNEMGFGK